MADENLALDTYGEPADKLVPAAAGDLSDYRQYTASRRRQAIVKVAFTAIAGVILITTVVYFTKALQEKEGKLKACWDGQDKFQPLAGKCFSVRVRSDYTSEVFTDSAEACQRHCFKRDWCMSVDFFGDVGECHVYNELSSEAEDDEFVDTRNARHGVEAADPDRLKWCHHYDRLCM